MFGLGPPELILILVILLLIFGGGRVRQLLGDLGKGVKEFREASETKDNPETLPPPTAPNTPPAGTSDEKTEQELREVRDTIVKQ